MTSKQTVLRWFTGLAGVGLVLGCLVAANAVLSSLRIRADLTEDKLYTLSQGTDEVLAGLDRVVTLKFYASRDLASLPIPLKNYMQQVADLLREYEMRGHGKLVLEVYDPKPDSDEEEWAQKYGVAGRPIDRMSGENLYFGLVAVAGIQEATLPFIAPSMEDRLEYEITRLIDEVSRSAKPKLGVLSPLEILPGAASPMMRQRSANPGWMFGQELQRQYDVIKLTPTLTEIPEEIDTLVVIHPKNFPDTLLFALDQFVLRGGRLLAFMDPLSMADQEQGSAEQFQMMMGYSSSLSPLLKAWGLSFTDEDVVSDLGSASVVNFGNGMSERLPTWLTLIGDRLNQEDIATSSLNSLMLPFAGAITGTPVEGLTVTPLLQTSKDGALISAMTASQAGVEKMRNAKPMGVMDLAVRVQGTFPTAFPDGAPGTNEVAKLLTQSEVPGVVILVGDVDVIYDRYAVRTMNVFGQTLYEPMNDNIALGMNLVEQITGSDALVGLRSRRLVERPFTRVIELQNEAQLRWQEEELNLVTSLQETQQRINELQRTQAGSADQQLIITPEMQQELEAFRDKRFEIQKQLKDVRKNLVRDIEQLGTRVKAINMALMPALVALFGVVHGVRRRRKALRSAGPSRESHS